MKNELNHFGGYRPFLLAVLFLSLYLAFIILRPFIQTIVLAIVLASIFYPLKYRLLRLYRGRENAAALTAVIVLTFLIVLPVLFFMGSLMAQGVDTVNKINTWISTGHLQELSKNPVVTNSLAWLQERTFFARIAESNPIEYLLQWSKSTGQFIISRGAYLLKDLAGIVFKFFVMIFITFFIIRDGQRILAEMRALSPLRDEQEERIIHIMKDVGRSVLLGSFLTALCQGLAGGIGLAIVGIPAFFWGSLMGFASLIPFVGMALIWVPAVGYLALMGRWKAALFLFLWCTLLVGMIDNFLRPFLMRGEGKMSPFYVFLAIIGGVTYFGLPGILYGPLILAFARVMLFIYKVEYRGLLDEKNRKRDAVSNQ
jgi:predicted PurR-regulated permease PerM